MFDRNLRYNIELNNVISRLLDDYNIIIRLEDSYVLYLSDIFHRHFSKNRRYMYMAVRSGCVNIVVDINMSGYKYRFEKVIDSISEIL